MEAAEWWTTDDGDGGLIGGLYQKSKYRFVGQFAASASSRVVVSLEMEVIKFIYGD